jgi:hypothetical protein
VAVYVVTPTLLVGEAPSGLGSTRMVSTPEDAVRLIRLREVAVLPSNSWWMARAVLQSLGLDEAAVERRIRFARTGRI